MRLKNRIAIVTGSAQGMGYAIAHALAEAGAKIVLCDISKEGVEKAVDEFENDFEHVLGEVVDVTKRDEVRRTVGNVVQKWGSIDVLVNNAGGALHTPHLLQEIEEKDWDLVVDVNLKGTFLFCQAVIPVMVEKGGGTIVNISALAAHWRASLAGVQYTAAKAGVEGLTRQLAYDWGIHGIRVNSVAPTVTITGERIKSLWDAKEEKEREKVLSQIPLRRLSTPTEIASAVVFLASDEASYITGITLDVSGGRYLR
ncbi:MAG: short-chain dehydrogenase [Spirochaetes bacterium DG_61]|nr:MAG: short-chain dehydrogenase [Spirochaetes bacterium DG_61]